MPPGDDDYTPKTSQSFAFFAEASTLLADKLDAVASLKRRVLGALDIHGAASCETLADELRTMHARFAAWPMADAERVAAERPVLVPRLTHLTREVADWVESLPPEARARLPK